MYDVHKDKVLTWGKVFPFVPKTVIIIMVAMDYHAIAAAPSWLGDATTGNGYANTISFFAETNCSSKEVRLQPLIIDENNKNSRNNLKCFICLA
jgi:hypothetical protein